MIFPFLQEKPREEVPQKPDHKHEWDLVAKTFVEPQPAITIVDNPEITKLAFTGMTTYLFQCSKCDEFRKQEVTGVESTALENLLAKVEIGGPEYILKDGKTFILMKQPENPPQNIPVRR